uniref:Uncharacterized protein n=1 Tax=Nelumbo nucifera TaxID=4432 RepID=A0A822YMS2_NELNU|nr:TPA_asm: hypothetical protein HUJ06_012224 [Nelumbo nucifera]
MGLLMGHEDPIELKPINPITEGLGLHYRTKPNGKFICLLLNYGLKIELSIKSTSLYAGLSIMGMVLFFVGSNKWLRKHETNSKYKVHQHKENIL